MHCPTCGAEFTNGLKFCKRCGSNLNSAIKPQEAGTDLGKFTGMFWAIGVFGIAGLALLIGGLLGVMGMGVRSKAVVIVAVFVLITILAIAGMLTLQLSRLIKMAEDAQSTSQLRGAEADSERIPAQIAEPPAAVSSVTEHTTRNMEPSKFKETVSRK